MEGLINGNLSLDDFKNQLGIGESSPEQKAEEVPDAQPVENESPSSNTEPQKKTEPNKVTEPTKADEAQPKPETQAPAAQPEAPTKTEEHPKPSAQELLDAAVKELYAYEAELLAKLGELKKEALDEYRARGGKREDLIAVGMEGLDKCYELEAQADVKVREVLDKLKADLEAIGADTTITKELWEYYCD